MLNTKDLVALTEYQQVGWRLIKVENYDNKNYKRHTQPNLTLLFNEIYSVTSNFDFAQPLTGSWRYNILVLYFHDWIHKNKIVVATKRLTKNASSYRKKKQGNALTFRNNKKKDWFSQETGVVFVYGEVCKGASKNSATFKMELSATLVTVESCKGLYLMGLQPIAF